MTGRASRPGHADLLCTLGHLGWSHATIAGFASVVHGTQIALTATPSEALAEPGAIPDVRGRSVLDVGAWDGKYSFEAERSGAARVVALDHYVWQLDWSAREAYWRECEAAGVLPDPAADARFLDREHLPGRRGFDVVAEFMSTDLRALGCSRTAPTRTGTHPRSRL